MKGFLSVLLLFISPILAQENTLFLYEPSEKYPYGRPNPAAPEQITDFSAIIGVCDCSSQRRNPDGSWADSVHMVWRFEYIMNGMGIQDKALHEDGRNAGSIRQFNADSSKWYVHYYNSTVVSPRLSTWSGTKTDDKIILSMPQKSPNGLEGFSRLTFYDMSDSGFKWIGEWHDQNMKIVYPFWKISCIKRK